MITELPPGRRQRWRRAVETLVAAAVVFVGFIGALFIAFRGRN